MLNQRQDKPHLSRSTDHNFAKWVKNWLMLFGSQNASQPTVTDQATIKCVTLSKSAKGAEAKIEEYDVPFDQFVHECLSGIGKRM